jgi:hypothetical protein
VSIAQNFFQRNFTPSGGLNNGKKCFLKFATERKEALALWSTCFDPRSTFWASTLGQKFLAESSQKLQVLKVLLDWHLLAAVAGNG